MVQNRLKQEGKTSCFSCRNFTDNVHRKKVTVTNKVIREKSKKSQGVLSVIIRNQFFKTKSSNNPLL